MISCNTRSIPEERRRIVWFLIRLNLFGKMILFIII